jgi:predicted double-glycine peptidase
VVHANLLVVPAVIGSAMFFWLGLILERNMKSRSVRIALVLLALALACPGLLFALYYTHLFDGAAWFYNLRTARFTELLACGMGLAAGMLHGWWQPESFGESVTVPSGLLVFVLVPFIKPILDPLDMNQLKDRFQGEVCLQSTFSTCGPASAVTLLRSFGDDVTEKELATESLTSRGGTEIWYLARALRRRGMATKIVIQSPEDSAIPSPAIAGVLLPGHAGHFIAVLNNDGTQVTIADPLKGKLVLSKIELAHSYYFTGFFLVLERDANGKQH